MKLTERIRLFAIACFSFLLALNSELAAAQESPFVVVLGIAQDGGFPQAGCRKKCCANLDPDLSETPACLAVVDPDSGERWLFECTPHFPQQLRLLDTVSKTEQSPGLSGIFLTHAHIGHYAGLIHLGREVMGTKEVPVHVMPRMRNFLKENGPWNQLVKLKNISLQPMAEAKTIQLNDRISVTPITVPHRDEFSETVAFKISGPQKSVLFLPDIDKWSRWETRVEKVIADVDVAFLDATFFDGNELPGRNMAQIPHPFVVESIKRFGTLSKEDRGKVRFIHLNHTNPALRKESSERATIEKAGMNVAKTGEQIEL